MDKFLKAAFAGVLIAAMSNGVASATVFTGSDTEYTSLGISTDPADWIAARYSDESNVDVGNQSPANVESVLETMAWFGMDVEFVGGGACGASPGFANDCTAFDLGGGNSNKGGISNLTAQVFTVHFGNRFVAFLFEDAVDGFRIDGLRFGVSNIYAFNKADDIPDVPVPGAVWLMVAGIAGLAGASRRYKRA